jgi:hypothetical protein
MGTRGTERFRANLDPRAALAPLPEERRAPCGAHPPLGFHNLRSVSPLSLRRYRAERLLREEFDRLRARVLGNVRARLRWSGVCLDTSDLEACYAQAWQGLYAAVLGGERIANPGGWLSVVTRASARGAAASGPSASARPVKAPCPSPLTRRSSARGTSPPSWMTARGFGNCSRGCAGG